MDDEIQRKRGRPRKRNIVRNIHETFKKRKVSPSQESTGDTLGNYENMETQTANGKLNSLYCHEILDTNSKINEQTYEKHRHENNSDKFLNGHDNPKTKIITLQDLKSIAPVNVLSLSTDLHNEDISRGPWTYVNSRKCTLNFTSQDSNSVHSMILQNFLARGAPGSESKSLTFRWYSWIRFKSIAKKKNTPLNLAVTDEKIFMSLLHDTNQFYRKNSRRQKEEGLEPNRGPQSFQDSLCLERLYYYGKGIVKYYRKATFLQVISEKYGENVKAEFLVNPNTTLICEQDFEFMLAEVQGILMKKYTRHLHKMKIFVGPQCNEDRNSSPKINYDIKFTSSLSSSSKKDLTSKENAKSVLNGVKTLKDSDLQEFFLRKCQNCDKLRWVDKKAANKFVLGSYTYSGKKKQVHFACNLLHNTSCDDESDIVPLLSFEKSPLHWVAYSNKPVIGFVLKTIRPESDKVQEVEVMAKYAQSNHELNRYKAKVMFTKFITGGHVAFGKMGPTSRFQHFKGAPNLLVGTLNRTEPREALVCQSWLDHSELSSEDPNASYSVSNLCGIRDVHSVYNAMTMVHCSHCGMCSPGFESEVSESIEVPEAGKDIPLENSSLLRALKQSQVLSTSCVILDTKFDRAKVVKDDGSVTGICIDCSKYCATDENGNVHLLHKNISNDLSSQETVNSQEPISDNISNLNPYSINNLMTLDVFQDDASKQYELFMDTLTQAEKLVLSPIHAVIVILRSRTNNIPFSRFGTISFAIKQPVKTKCLPWHSFNKLPFVVMVSKNEDGSVTEAKINMSKIIHAKELMEREVTCPVYGTKRPFYRYCDKVHTPFSADAMHILASQLSDDSSPVVPTGLRKINIEKIHERSTKRVSFQLFSEWLDSGFSIGSTIKESFESSWSQCDNQRKETLYETMWKVLQDFVMECNKKKESKGEAVSNTNDYKGKCNKNTNIEYDQVTPPDIVKYAVLKGWLNPSSDVTSLAVQNLPDEDELRNVTYLMCEELELLLRECGNDEGESTSVAHGGVDCMPSENPEEILAKGVKDTVLQRVPGPVVDKEIPVAEDTPGYLPMAFPDVFLTGDGCPNQERPRSIKNSSGSYQFTYLKWLCQQPRAMVNTELQFLIHSMVKRHHSRGKAKLAMRSGAFDQHGLPLKEELVNNAKVRDWTVSNLMMFKSSIPDTTPFWKKARDDAIAVQRDWEDVAPWQENKTPLSVMLFQTRAPPYNHHPAIHQICPGSKDLFQCSDEEFLMGRQRNVLKYPSIISFICALMAELDTTFLSRLRNGVDSYFTRFEWGANANPHSHRLCFSEKFSEYMVTLQQRIDGCLQTSKDEALELDQDLSNPIVLDSIRTKVLDCWDKARLEYIEYMRPFYTNWNAGMLADGTNKTFDFVFERKSTTCRLNMANVIDQALTSGQFSTLDTVYVSVVNGTCRHLGHTGINDQPAKSDKCAVVKRKRVKNNDSSVQYKDVITCKRRKPQPLNKTPTIQPDPCNKKLVQLQFESNDKWFNGHDPFEILHILSNADDKAVVPEFLRKPPTLNLVQNKTNDYDDAVVELDLCYFSDTGDSATEYVTKYAFKDVINSKTPAQILVTAMEKLDDGDPINQGTVQKMYNVHANAGTTSVFQATHLNQNIPHVFSNVNIKNCNISGLSMFRKDYTDEDGEDFLVPNLIRQFDRRHESSIICLERGKQSEELKEELQRDMCLHQFCDLYDVKETKSEGTQRRRLVFRRRRSAREGRVNALKLIPCHGKKFANPRNKSYWIFCRTLCLWKIPCHKTTDISPVGDDEESVKNGWIELFNHSFVDGKGLPPWAYKYWKHFNVNVDKDDDSDSNSDQDLEEIDKEIQKEDNLAVNQEKDITGIKMQCEGDNESNCLPVIGKGNEQFYQNPIDLLRAAQLSSEKPSTIDDLKTNPMLEFDPDSLANPEGVDFMKNWLGDRSIPTVNEVHAQMSNLSNSEGITSAHNFDASTLNEKQKYAHDLVVEYVEKRMLWEEKGHQKSAPKPLRLVLMGNPGTGKSWTLKCLMSTLIDRLGIQTDAHDQERNVWVDRIKLAAPTGAASSQMHFQAQTLHRLFCIPIHLNEKNLHLDENSKTYSRLLLNFDPRKLVLLIIDEFSMLSRQIFAFMTERMIQCGIDFQKIGIVLIGDPAQILPIGGDPLWSARLKNDQGKECSKVSILGMMRFREIFMFKQMQTAPNFDKWETLSTPKQRLLSDDITICRKWLMNADFDAVFLTEVKRSDDDPVSKEFTGKILINLRYGKKCREKEINFLMKHCATEAETKANKKWRTANIIHGFHYHSSDHSGRHSVEADNAKALLRHNKDSGNPIMRLDSIHQPIEKESKLKAISAKDFEGAPSKWYACKGMRVMLLRNIAPSLGLYNGSIHTLIGPIYDNDSVEVTLTPEHLHSAVLRDCRTTLPINCRGKGKLIPPRSRLLSINGTKFTGNLPIEMTPKTELNCKFSLPSTPPAMPDFMVIEASNYSGPNILKLPGCENYVPIAPVENHKQVKKESKIPQVRIALPLEGGDAATSFKGQGATFSLAEVDLDGWFHVPGIFLVAISRVKSPRNLHIRKLPNSLDLTLQRLQENVLDAQSFEEAVRAKSECSYRHQNNCKDPFWSDINNLIADAVVQESLTNGQSIRDNSKQICNNISKSIAGVDEQTVNDVILKLIQTKEYLVAERAPHITLEDFDTLQNYKNTKKSVQTRIKPNKSEKSTSCQSFECHRPKKKHKCQKTDVPSDANSNKLPTKEILKPRPDITRFTLKGLQNSGNNICFINAAVIALCHSVSFDTFLRECHSIHAHCIDGEACPLCALYEIMNRAYRHQRLLVTDIHHLPIIKLTESLLPGWHLGIEHDADEFLTQLLQRLNDTVGCSIHIGNVKTMKTCQNCKLTSTKERHQPIRIFINLLNFQQDEVRIQDGVTRWSLEQKVLNCNSCGENMHQVNRVIINPPSLLIININRIGTKKTLVDHHIIINDLQYVFRASINFHPRHYTAVGCVSETHYVFYSDEEVQSCHGNIIGNQQYQVMNRVRAPLEDNATVLLYEIQRNP